MFRSSKKSFGFTLLELLVVISIISMLSSVIVAAIHPAREKAVDSKINSLASQYINALELYNLDYNGYPYDPDTPSIGSTGDINGDHVVNADDMLALISAWGPCSGPCPADISPEGGDGLVNVQDLIELINIWGWWHPVCLGEGNIGGVCQFYNLSSGQTSSVINPEESSVINDALNPYIGGNILPASNDVISGENSSGGAIQLKGIVYGCMEKIPDVDLCDKYFLMWFQKYNTKCAGGSNILFQPDNIKYCVYSNAPEYFQSGALGT